MPKQNHDILIPPTPGAPNAILSRKQKSRRAESALNNAIDAIDVVRELMPLDLARGALAAISGVLGLVQRSITNQEDFAELAEQCHKIGLVVWRATSTVSEERISPALLRAIDDLKESVDGIRQEIDRKLRKGLASRVFHITVNKELITGWQRDLDRLLNLLNTELNISANVKLDELMTLLEEFRVSSKAHTNSSLPDTLPPKPPIFTGREDFVMSTVNSLLKFRHVALIGPGGMGKTSIARAVLNDDSVSAKFGKNRYFVQYDDMDPSQITHATFLNQIARVLGVSSSQADMQIVVTKALSSSEVLLVLDNAESFLDAEKDSGRIAQAIDDFGAHPNVAIMLTSRTVALPPNLSWERLYIPALEENPACAAFRFIYTQPIEQSILIKLLSSIDFHPLSINILAQAAVQNQWSPDDLVDAWDRQHALLLDNGDGKFQSIAATVEISLNSPSLKKFGDTVWHLAQLIAFLPQGISKTRIAEIFESDATILRCADVLCKHSLAYDKDNFVTMLAPIRLYISTRFSSSTPLQIPLFAKLRTYYEEQLFLQPINKTLIRSEDVNIERIMAFSLAHSSGDDVTDVIQTTVIFLFALTEYKPRPTSLLPIISTLQPPESMSPFLSFNFRSSTDFLIAKGNCIYALALLAFDFGQFTEARDLFDQSRELYLACGSAGRLQLQRSDVYVGRLYHLLGDYTKAEAVYEAVIRRRTYLFTQSDEDRQIKAYATRCLGSVKATMGRPGGAELCLAGLSILQRIGDLTGVATASARAGYAELSAGNNEDARRHFRDALKAWPSDAEEYRHDHASIFLGMAEVSFRQGSSSESRGFREKVHSIIQQSLNPNRNHLLVTESIIVAYEFMDGDKVESLRKMGLLIERSQQMGISAGTMICLYSAGCTGMRANDMQTAAEYFTQTVDYCKALSEVHYRARALRALGEIALVDDDAEGAMAKFEEARSLCDFMGVPPKALYPDYSCHMLSEAFTGWDNFLASRPFSTS